MSPKELDAALRALAHHERRTLLLGCLDRRRSAGELAERSTLAMATVSEHLKVLRKTGLVTVEKEEIISFAEEGEASSRYPINPGSATFEWYGPAPTSITYADGKFVVPPTTFAVGKVTYRSTARAYSLSGVSFPAALVLWTGKAP